MTQNLAECRVCHLMIRTEAYSVTVCDYCMEKLIRRAEDQEMLDRNNERHHTR